MKTKPYIQNQRLSVVREQTVSYPEKVTTSTQIAKVVRDIITPLGYDLSYQEHIFVLGLNGQMKIQLFAHLSTGCIDKAMLDQRVLFSHLLLSNCSRFILIHNHPSGVIAPSESDNVLTKRTKESAKLLELILIDHLILSGTDDNYYSFGDQGKL